MGRLSRAIMRGNLPYNVIARNIKENLNEVIHGKQGIIQEEKRSKIKKYIQYLCVGVMIMSSFLISYASVVNGATFWPSNWYSDYDYVGYWEEPPKVFLLLIQRYPIRLKPILGIAVVVH